jgi:hypothetical protein
MLLLLLVELLCWLSMLGDDACCICGFDVLLVFLLVLLLLLSRFLFGVDLSPCFLKLRYGDSKVRLFEYFLLSA